MKKKRRKKSPRTKLIKYLDILWSKITKVVYGFRCEWCGSTENLQSDHIVNRWKFLTRWVIENCLILCMPCHIFRKKREPYEWAKLADEKRGPDTIQALKVQANRPEKVDLEQVQRYLEGMAKEHLEDTTILGAKA